MRNVWHKRRRFRSSSILLGCRCRWRLFCYRFYSRFPETLFRRCKFNAVLRHRNLCSVSHALLVSAFRFKCFGSNTLSSAPLTHMQRAACGDACISISQRAGLRAMSIEWHAICHITHQREIDRLESIGIENPHIRLR